jgi:hypothetical protein
MGSSFISKRKLFSLKLTRSRSAASAFCGVNFASMVSALCLSSSSRVRANREQITTCQLEDLARVTETRAHDLGCVPKLSVVLDFHAYRNRDGTVAKAWAKRFPVTVKNGVLHGDFGTKGAPSWYELSGKIEAGGAANLTVNGITGDPGYTPTHPEPGLRFHYQVIARFNARQGIGHSVGDLPPPLAPRTRIYTFVKD